MRVLSALLIAATLPMPGAPAVAGPLPQAETRPAAKPRETKQQRLNQLYDRLAVTRDAHEGVMIASRIQALQLRSGSATADLLVTRALSVASAQQPALALKLLDQVVVLDPDWAEGWNQRATLRFLNFDDSGSMRDIARVLKLEPRHFGALNGMAQILHRNGMDKDALTIYRHLLKIYPTMNGLKKAVDDLTLKVEGRPI